MPALVREISILSAVAASPALCTADGKLLMVTHSMQQAVYLGDCLVMMHQGLIAYRFEGAEKKRLRVSDLLARFDELRRRDTFDETAAALLEANYC